MIFSCKYTSFQNNNIVWSFFYLKYRYKYIYLYAHIHTCYYIRYP